MEKEKLEPHIVVAGLPHISILLSKNNRILCLVTRVGFGHLVWGSSLSFSKSFLFFFFFDFYSLCFQAIPGASNKARSFIKSPYLNPGTNLRISVFNQQTILHPLNPQLCGLCLGPSKACLNNGHPEIRTYHQP